MKRYVILGIPLAGLLLWLLLRHHTESQVVSEAPPQPSQQLAITNLSQPIDTDKATKSQAMTSSGLTIISNTEEEEYKREERYYRAINNVPVAFYGLVVDQDSNALQNVSIDVEVYCTKDEDKTIKLSKQTGTNGRFELSGLIGRNVIIERLSKEGYEEDFPGKSHGTYAAQSGSFTDPVTFRMWSTNLHEALVSGEKSFVVNPDGRHYAINLLNGTIAEGEDGDIVAWIKRPENVRWGERYDWSCQVAVPAGGLFEENQYAMFSAPESGYANAFTNQLEASSSKWGPLTGDKRFYVRLRNGQMYGRIVINLYADYHGKQPAMIQLSYAVNPSGSRLLR